MVVYHPEMLVRVPADIPMEQASVVPCSAITALHAVENVKESLDQALQYKG